MLASVAQHQREKNAEQTANRMKGRLMNGYSVFAAPMGYVYKRTGSHGKLLTRDEPLASILKEGLEAYACGRIASQAELKRFFEAQPAFPKDLPGGQIRQQRVSDILSRVVYAGYVEHEPWGVTRRKGHHEPIISLETYEQIQTRRNARPVAPARQDINLDFPMRGFVCCAECGTPMTSCWSKSGTGQKHPYYLCHKRGCSLYRKSFRREEVEGSVEAVLQQLQPSRSLYDIVAAMLRHAWDIRMDQQVSQSETLAAQVRTIDSEIGKTLDKIMAANSPTVIAAFERRVEDLERERLLLEEKQARPQAPRLSFEQVFELAMGFLSSPWKIYESGSFALKRMALKLAFKGPITYDRETGVRTTQPADIFRFLDGITENCEMVPPHGLEPRTY
ncbi:recombinase zinc beta ribbon domain-containing protein [Ponticoccus gilvus]|nr:recombinase zinc beta ribbon domain-containing protein [Enemella evansiae]